MPIESSVAQKQPSDLNFKQTRPFNNYKRQNCSLEQWRKKMERHFYSTFSTTIIYLNRLKWASNFAF
jgi:hypothetical protein